MMGLGWTKKVENSIYMATLAQQALQQALQQAFRERNVELSVAAHAERAEEKHAGGAYIKSLVYGGRHHNDLRDRLRRGWDQPESRSWASRASWRTR